MLRFEADTLEVAQGPIMGPEHQALLMGVDGAHSAGKSTLLLDYIAPKELLTDPTDMSDFGSKHAFAHLYPYVCVAEEVDGVQVPIVIVSEAARQIDNFYPDRQLLTTGYSRDGQAKMTLRTISSAQGGGMSALDMARQLQPDRKTPVAAVLCDRGSLSGFAYARLRLPEEDHTRVDLANISDIPTPPYEVDVASQAFEFAKLYDRVFLADHTEIPLEADGKRLKDETLRDDVAHSIHALYGYVLPAEKVTHIKGDRGARVAQLSEYIRTMLRQRMQATTA